MKPTARASLCASALLLVAALAACGGDDDGEHSRGDAGAFHDVGYVPLDADVSACPQGNEQVQQYILVPRCGSCHGAVSPQAGLDLVSPNVAQRLANVASSACAGQTLLVPNDPADSYVIRKVTDATPACGSRMPLTGPLSNAEIACLQLWVQGGLQPSDPDAGAPPGWGDGGTAWTPTPGTTPPCDDRVTGPDMCPGADCLSCHRSGGRAGDWDQQWTVAGTVFSSPTDPITAGIAGATVTLTDANGNVERLVTSTAGNFYTLRALTFPLMARIESGARVSQMPIPVPSGSCNSCHTLPSANGTAGRVYLSP